MNIDEATKLYWHIWEKYKHLQPEVRRIGNGERVVFLAASDYFLWSWKDWWMFKDNPSIAY